MVKIITKLALLDGSISDQEKLLVKKRFSSHFKGITLNWANSLFEKYAKEPELELNEDFRILKKVSDPRNASQFVNLLINISLVDRFLSVKEEAFLKLVCKKLGVHQNTLNSILAMRTFVYESNTHKKREGSSSSLLLKNAYLALELSPDSDSKAVKRKYRELAKIYHPDKVSNPNLRESAKKQFQAITEAYETIKNKRG